MRFRVGVTAGAQCGYEDLRLPDFSCLWVHHRHRLPGIVDEQFFTRLVLLAHHRFELFGPRSIVMAELAVPVTVGLFLSVLHPQ